MHPVDALALFALILLVAGAAVLLRWALEPAWCEQPWDDEAGVSERNVAGDSRR